LLNSVLDFLMLSVIKVNFWIRLKNSVEMLNVNFDMNSIFLQTLLSNKPSNLVRCGATDLTKAKN